MSRPPPGDETDVLKKIDALELAAKAGDGRLDPVVLTEATQIVDRAGQRLRMSGDLTVSVRWQVRPVGEVVVVQRADRARLPQSERVGDEFDAAGLCLG